MSVRAMSTFTLGLLLVLTGCSNGGEPPPGGPAAQEESVVPTGPSYSRYADYPGPELRYTGGGMSVGMRMKAVETRWLTELAGSSAQVGFHYLAVYVVATGEEPDRGVEDARLDHYSLGLRFGTGDACHRDNIGNRVNDDEENCHDNAGVVTMLWDHVPYRDWATYEWDEGMTAGIPLEAGATVTGVVAFSVPDDFEVTAPIEFCATYGDEVNMEYGNCVTVTAPIGERG